MRPDLVDLMSKVMPAHVAHAVAPSWFMFVGLAGLVTLLLMLRAARTAGVDPGVVASAILWGYLAAVGAGIAVPMAIDVVEQLIATGRFRLRWAGMTSFWGMMAGAVAVAVVAWRGKISLGRLGDLAAAPLGIALYLARMGCFVAGCDYGKVTAAPWAVRFPAGSPAWRDHVRAGLVPQGRAESLPVHPTQLYEAFLGLAIMVIAIVVARRPWAKAKPGRVALAAIAAYAIGRFGIEMLRGDVGRGFFGPLSSGQVFSIAVLAAMVLGWMWSRQRRGAIVAAAVAVALLPSTVQAQPSAGTPVPEASSMPAPPPIPTDSGATADDDRSFVIGVLAGVSAPLNRKNGQVPPLAGPSLSLGFRLPHAVSAWVDFDSLGNDDATHGTLLASLQWETEVRDRWSFAPRFGLGTTLVNFDTPAFRDISGFTMRAEASLEVELADRWVLWLRPASFDLLTANDLGGPIFSWQFRVGVAYQHRKRKPRPAPAPPPYPPPYPAPTPTPTPSPSPSPTPSPSPDPAPLDPY